MKTKKFAFEVLSQAEMNPVVGGYELASSSTTGKNQTTSSGSDNDSKSGDQDSDKTHDLILHWDNMMEYSIIKAHS